MTGGDVDRAARSVLGVETEGAAQAGAGTERRVGVSAEQGVGSRDSRSELEFRSDLRRQLGRREQHPNTVEERRELEPRDVLGAHHDVVVDDVDGDTADQVGDRGGLRFEPVVELFQPVFERVLTVLGLLDDETGVLRGRAGLVELFALAEADDGRALFVEPDTCEDALELLARLLGETSQLLAALGVLKETFGTDLEIPLQRFDQFGRQCGRRLRRRLGLGDGGYGAEEQHGG